MKENSRETQIPGNRARKRVGKSGFIFLFFGIIAIVFSLSSTSTILAFIGLTLIFWGALFLLVLPTKYVKSKVLDSMAFSPLSAINKIIEDSNYRGKAVYLPPYPRDVYVPKHLREFGDGFVFISTENAKVESVIEQAITENPKGLRLIPPGLSLANLLKKELDVNLLDTNPDFLVNTLPSLLMNDFELAEDLRINLDKDLVHVEATGVPWEDFCKGVGKLANICSNVGCPLISSIACVLTEVTNRPVVIEECALRNNAIEAWYRILKG
mgnify:CR=1 FL=1